MLSIEQLSYCYPSASVAALDKVSFHVSRGEVLGLLGPNGAGKTTLISHLSGALPVQQGRICVDDLPLAQARKANPLKIAVAPQEYAFYPSLTVIENLDCFAGAGGLCGARKTSRIAHSLTFSQLERYTKVRADQLSGGLKRRLNLAIALLHEPELLLFDEPTVGVDPQSRAFLIEAVKKLAQDGCAVIYTSHYMEEVQAIAERVVILDHGRVLIQGALGELLQASQTPLQISVQGGHIERLQTLLACFGEVTPINQGVQIKLTDPASFAQVVATLESNALTITQARFGDTDLEQLFMSLTHYSLRD